MLAAGTLSWAYIQIRRSANLSSVADEARGKAERLRAIAGYYARDASRGWSQRPNGTRLPVSSTDAAVVRRWEKEALAKAGNYDMLVTKYKKAARCPRTSVDEDESPPPLEP
jgi:hypothetical protein